MSGRAPLSSSGESFEDMDYVVEQTSSLFPRCVLQPEEIPKLDLNCDEIL